MKRRKKSLHIFPRSEKKELKAEVVVSTMMTCDLKQIQKFLNTGVLTSITYQKVGIFILEIEMESTNLINLKSGANDVTVYV